jgi:hypothetical protein
MLLGSCCRATRKSSRRLHLLLGEMWLIGDN